MQLTIYHVKWTLRNTGVGVTEHGDTFAKHTHSESFITANTKAEVKAAIKAAHPHAIVHTVNGVGSTSVHVKT